MKKHTKTITWKYTEENVMPLEKFLDQIKKLYSNDNLGSSLCEVRIINTTEPNKHYPKFIDVKTIKEYIYNNEAYEVTVNTITYEIIIKSANSDIYIKPFEKLYKRSQLQKFLRRIARTSQLENLDLRTMNTKQLATKIDEMIKS